MPRLSSMRSLGAFTYPGLVAFLVLALVSASSPVIAQMGEGGAYGDSSRQQASLVNVASSVKRPDGFSSLSGVQALLYGDVSTVVHVDFTKIDYVSLSSYLNEVVEGFAGQIPTRDSYRVDLRKYQVNQLKDDFKSFLSTLQNVVTEKLYANNIDELYVIQYGTGPSTSGTTIIAVPIEGFSEAERAKVVDALADFDNPIVVFTRYGFAISVVGHDKAEPQVDASKIKARYVAKTLEKRQLEQALSAANSGAAGNNGQQTNERGGSVNGSLHRDPTASAGNAAMVNSVASNAKVLGSVEIDPEFLADYKAELETEREQNRLKSRRVVIPSIRERFGAPAKEDASMQLAKALRTSNGAAIVIATNDFKSVFDALLSTGTNPSASSAFSGLGKESGAGALPFATDAAKNPAFADFTEALAEHDPGDSVKAFTLAFSLVKTPRIVAFAKLNSADDATNSVEKLQQLTGVIKPLARALVSSMIQDSVADGEALDVSPLLDSVFDSLAPKAVDDQIAVTLDFGTIRDNIGVFSPLINGGDDQSGEMEDIEWNTEEDENGVGDEQGGLDDDDPYRQDEDDSAFGEDEPAEDDSLDDSPFGDDDEDSPF